VGEVKISASDGEAFVQLWEACNSLHGNKMRRPARRNQHLNINECWRSQSTKELSIETIDFINQALVRRLDFGLWSSEGVVSHHHQVSGKNKKP